MSKSQKALKPAPIAPATAPAIARFIKLDAAGKELPADSADAVAVRDAKTGLVWSLEETKPMPWKKALTYPASLKLCGFDDWRLPTCEELLTLVDRSRYNPAIDVAYFPACKSSWYWASTPAACSPGGYAWYVDFADGDALWYDQDYGGCVRAVRASQSF